MTNLLICIDNQIQTFKEVRQIILRTKLFFHLIVNINFKLCILLKQANIVYVILDKWISHSFDLSTIFPKTLSSYLFFGIVWVFHKKFAHIPSMSILKILQSMMLCSECLVRTRKYCKIPNPNAIHYIFCGL